jgi:hypothetical protein
VPVEVREWIGPAPASPGFVLDAHARQLGGRGLGRRPLSDDPQVTIQNRSKFGVQNRFTMTTHQYAKSLGSSDLTVINKVFMRPTSRIIGPSIHTTMLRGRYQCTCRAKCVNGGEKRKMVSDYHVV